MDWHELTTWAHAHFPDDVAQHVLMRLWERGGTVTSPRAYARMVARHHAVDGVRSMKGVEVEPLNDDVVVSPEPRPDRVTAARERLARIPHDITEYAAGWHRGQPAMRKRIHTWRTRHQGGSNG